MFGIKKVFGKPGAKLLNSKYETWDSPTPYLNPEKKKFIDWELLEEYEPNIFKDSHIPIVKNKEEIKYRLSTSAFIEENNHYAKVSSMFYTYDLMPYDKLCAWWEFTKLNLLLIKKNGSIRYCFLRLLNKWSDTIYLSYDYEKNEFKLFAYYELPTKGIDNITIIYKEDGTIKSATIKRMLRKGLATSKFKSYKTGFDLYMVTYGGKIVYRRK